MTKSNINANLHQMSYDEFQDFMQGLAQLYSGVSSNFNYMALFKDLSTIAKRVERLPKDFFTLYGAYEIADSQVVLAVFRIHLDRPIHSDTAPDMHHIEVSFAEDERNLQCSARIRQYLTQTDFVARAEIAYPTVMEDLLWEQDPAKKKPVKNALDDYSIEMKNLWFSEDIPF